LEEDLLEAVIGLPSKLFYGAGIPACLFIMNRNKAKKRRGKVFFLYGANDYQEGKKQNTLRPQDIKKIVAAYREESTIEKYCRSVSIGEIRENDSNLNINRYIDITEEEEQIHIQRTIDELKEMKSKYEQIENKAFNYLKELKFKV